MTSYFLDSNPARQPPIDGPAFVFFFMCCCCCCAGKLADRKLQSLAERKRKKEKEKKEKKKNIAPATIHTTPRQTKGKGGESNENKKSLWLPESFVSFSLFMFFSVSLSFWCVDAFCVFVTPEGMRDRVLFFFSFSSLVYYRNNNNKLLLLPYFLTSLGEWR